MKEATRIEYAPTPPEVLRCRVRHHPPHLDHHNAGRAHVSDHETWQVIPERRRHKVIGRHRQCVGLHHHNLTPRGPCAVYWSGAACRYPNPSFTHLYGTVLPHSVGELPLLLSSDRVTTRAAASKPRGWLRCETHSACCYCWLSVRRTGEEGGENHPRACGPPSQRESCGWWWWRGDTSNRHTTHPWIVRA